MYAIPIQISRGARANSPLSAAAVPSTTTTTSLTIIARKLRFMRPSGVSAPTTISRPPAKAPDTKLMMQPAIIAGSIFTFSLSLGDYISVDIVGGTTQMIGNVVLRNFGANNIPFAAALATIPVAVMVIYLTAVRRTGALDNL